MTVTETLSKLESLRDEKIFQFNEKHYNLNGKQYGVKSGDIKKLAKQIKSNHSLAKELWETNNFSARQLVVVLLNPKKITLEEVEWYVNSLLYTAVADWFTRYAIKGVEIPEKLRLKWLQSPTPLVRRVGWDLTATMIQKHNADLDINSLLSTLEKEMGSEHEHVQWTMNTALANIGIEYPEFRKQAIEIGNKLGIYKDYPTPKGCTSPFAPIWIEAIVRRKEGK